MNKQGSKFKFVKYVYTELTAEMSLQRSEEFYKHLDARHTVRHFSSRDVPEEIMNNVILTASTAPSGAHKQPWTFCLISSSKIKKQIREGAEKEEYENYHGRMPKAWIEDLAPLGTDWNKPFIDEAPWLIVVFKRIYENVNGEIRNNYYVSESVGLACGMLLTAIHHAGLIALTHTPSPMNFLASILNRPENERPFLLIPVGYPTDDAKVPDLRRKKLDEIRVLYD